MLMHASFVRIRSRFHARIQTMFPKSPPGTKRTGKNMRGPHIKHLSHMHGTGRVQEMCQSRGGRPGLPVLMSLTVSVDVKQH